MFEGRIVGSAPKVAQCPTSVRNEKTYEYISMNPNQNHESLDSTRTISYLEVAIQADELGRTGPTSGRTKIRHSQIWHGFFLANKITARPDTNSRRTGSNCLIKQKNWRAGSSHTGPSLIWPSFFIPI